MKRLLLIFLFNTDILLAESIYITGAVESQNTQHVLMPLVPSFNGKISDMVEEGSFVNKGDFLVKIDGSSVDSQIEAQIEQLNVFKATAEKKDIDLKIQLNQSLIAYERAKTAKTIAQVKSQVPLDFIGELAYKQNQLTLKNAEKSYLKASNDLTEARLKQQENKQETLLGIAQKQKKLTYLQDTIKKFSIHASQEGYVIYSTQAWSGEKIQIGDQMNSGIQILSVSESSNLQIIAWVNAIDRPKISVNTAVTIQFDAFMQQNYRGQITHIASGGEDKQIWGDALYYKTTIQILEQTTENLLIGMSALVEIEAGEAHE